MRLLSGHSKTTWSRIVLLINSVVNKYNYITATNVWIHGLIKPQNNEHLRFTSFEEKSALNISGKFECTYEWIFAYFNKYRKNEALWKCRFLVKLQWLHPCILQNNFYKIGSIGSKSLTERLLLKWIKKLKK